MPQCISPVLPPPAPGTQTSTSPHARRRNNSNVPENPVKTVPFPNCGNNSGSYSWNQATPCAPVCWNVFAGTSPLVLSPSGQAVRLYISLLGIKDFLSPEKPFCLQLTAVISHLLRRRCSQNLSRRHNHYQQVCHATLSPETVLYLPQRSRCFQKVAA